MLVPQDSLLDAISLRLQEAMTASGVSREDLTAGVQEQRAQIVREPYAHLLKPDKPVSKIKQFASAAFRR